MVHVIGDELIPTQAGPVRARICRDPRDGTWIGVAAVQLPQSSGIGATPAGMSSLSIMEVVHERDIANEVLPLVAQVLAEPMTEIGFGIPSPIHLAGRTFSNVKLATRAIVQARARKQLLKKLERGAKKTAVVIDKVYTSPAFAGVVGVTSALTAPFGGAALGVTYAISIAAIKLAKAIKKKDPTALAQAAQIAAAAAAGSPQAKAVLGEVQRQMQSLDATIQQGPQIIADKIQEQVKSL